MKIKTDTVRPGHRGWGFCQKRGRVSLWSAAFKFGSAARARGDSASGFILIETIVATLLAGIMLPTLYAGLGAGFSLIQVTRENLRATQVIVERMESVRLVPYKTLSAAYPTNVTEYYSPSGQTNGSGTVYAVTYNCVPAPSSLPPAYRSNMMSVTVTASWKSGKVQRARSMQSYVARYGVQRYVSGN